MGQAQYTPVSTPVSTPASTPASTLTVAAVGALVVGLLTLATLASPAYAQNRNSQQADRAATAAATDTRTARPLWSELSPKQQAVLAPLAADWEGLDSTRRKKWVAIANRYPSMGSGEQQRLQDRMQAWAKLTPQERRVARDNYRALRQLPSSQRKEVRQQWQQRQTAAPAGTAAEATSDTTTDNAAK